MNYQEFLEKKLKKDVRGKLYVLKSDVDALNLNQDDYRTFKVLLKSYNIVIRKVRSDENRSILVNDCDYGEHGTYEINQLDKPRIAKFNFNENGDLIGEDYQELDKRLDDFIETYVIMKQKRDKVTGEIIFYPSIRLGFITKLKLSELELKHALEYLANKGIRVGGRNESLESEFENYDYCITYKNIDLNNPLTEKEEYEKFYLYQKTKDCGLREELILHNMRLVRYVAWIYSNFYGINISELESFGYEALILAVEKFDVTRGFKFSSYAISYIKNYIKKGCQEILTGKKDRFSSAYIQIKRFVERDNATNFIESFELLNEIVDRMLKYRNTGFVYRESVEKKIKFLNPILLNEEHLLPIEIEDEVIKKIDAENLKKKIESILKTLKPREEWVIKLRFGLLDGKFHTLQSIANKLSVSLEMIRKIEKKALTKLTDSSVIEILERTYLYDEELSNKVIL